MLNEEKYPQLAERRYAHNVYCRKVKGSTELCARKLCTQCAWRWLGSEEDKSITSDDIAKEREAYFMSQTYKRRMKGEQK